MRDACNEEECPVVVGVHRPVIDVQSRLICVCVGGDIEYLEYTYLDMIFNVI
jgi:hypothetical protein